MMPIRRLSSLLSPLLLALLFCRFHVVPALTSYGRTSYRRVPRHGFATRRFNADSRNIVVTEHSVGGDNDAASTHHSTASKTAKELYNGTSSSPSVASSTSSSQCGFCQATFVSRNAMFRHMRTECRQAPTELVEPRLERSSLILFLGYNGILSSSPRQIGDVVIQALNETLLQIEHDRRDHHASSFRSNVKILGSTQSAVTKSRPACLGPDDNAAAAEDVLIVNLLTPVDFWDETSQERTSTGDSMSSSVLSVLGHRIAKLIEVSYPNGNVRLHGLRRIPIVSKQYLHAEQSCSQHVYHYLLPAAWLDDVNDIWLWYGQNCDKPQQERDPAPDTVRRFKHVLKSTESAVASTRQQGRFGGLGLRVPKYWHNYANPDLRLPPNYDAVRRVVDRARVVDFVTIGSGHMDDNDDIKSSNANINSSSIESSNEESSSSELFLVCSITGDEFLQEQVSRIIGTALAVTKGWLPANFMEQSVQRDTLLETVPAPVTHHLYKATSRFHYAELCDRGQQLWQSSDTVVLRNDSPSTVSGDPIAWIHAQLLPYISGNTSMDWLLHVRDVVAPRIRAKLASSSRMSSTLPTLGAINNQLESTSMLPDSTWSPSLVLLPPPDAYQRVLKLLRQLVATNTWPATSVARSQVILGTRSGENSEVIPAPIGHNSGSFTVVSESLFDCSNFALPMANSLFPELVAAVFELEQDLTCPETGQRIRTVHLNGTVTDSSVANDNESRSRRPPSSHCAINANAQFTPHVDSGRGLGQSLSMIVGLGDYYNSNVDDDSGSGNGGGGGGQLVVEGTPFDIRYQPLQFDGWKLRHWTAAFTGERFSLVWFTPEGMIRKNI